MKLQTYCHSSYCPVTLTVHQTTPWLTNCCNLNHLPHNASSDVTLNPKLLLPGMYFIRYIRFKVSVFDYRKVIFTDKNKIT